jgi:LuxR family quorum-sensing system transcriptional regulator CciR
VTVALTLREIEVMTWAARGKSCWATAQILGISEHTVDFHRDQAMAKLGVGQITAAVARAVELGLIRVEA